MKAIPLFSFLLFSVAAFGCKVSVDAIDTPGDGGSSAACQTNAQCIDANGGHPFICTQDHVCVAIETPDCHILAEASDLRNDDTVWLGVVYPKSGPSSAEGTARIAAVDLARDEISRAGGLPPTTLSGRARQLGFVVCDEAGVAPSAHLIKDLHVPAILGYLDSNNFVAAAADAVANGVLLIGAGPSSPRVSQIGAGAPRLVWRTTPSDAQIVLAMAKAVASFEEAAARARPGAPTGPIRVALVRPADPALDEIVLQNLSINGQRFADAGSAGKMLVYDPASATKAEYMSIVDQLFEFQPDIVLTFGGAEVGPKIVEPLESSWPTSLRPLYIISGSILPSLTSQMVANADLRHRTVVVDTDSTRPALKLFQYALAADNPHLPPVAPKIATTYDAAYTLALSVAAGGSSLSGASLANALPKLTTGRAITVGPSELFAAFSELHQGTIDLEGASGPLDFQANTGDVHADMEIGCVNAEGSVEPSGAYYRYATSAFEGQVACP